MNEIIERDIYYFFSHFCQISSAVHALDISSSNLPVGADSQSCCLPKLCQKTRGGQSLFLLCVTVRFVRCSRGLKCGPHRSAKKGREGNLWLYVYRMYYGTSLAVSLLEGVFA